MGAAEDRAMTDDSTAELQIEPGQILAGKYRVEEEIGSGGMGIVVSARHVTMGHRLAIKLLKVHEDKDPSGAVARFVREARAAARIQSDHVVRVIDVSALPDGTPYMVMEYLEGEDLRQVLERRGELAVEEAVGYILQACEGLAEAHAVGVVHRDLKPSNLFLAKKSNGTTVLKILDFGISKVSPKAGEAGITTTGALMGSPLYMAPEQMRSTKNVDARADIWSLGLILYELLAGVPPFAGETIPEVCLAVMGEEPIPIRRVRSDVPIEIETILTKCLEKKRENRFESMGALARALEQFAGSVSRVHVQRASIAAKTVRSEAPSLPVEGPPPMPAPKRLGSRPDGDKAAGRRRDPDSVASWASGRARPRRTKAMWIALGVAACVGAGAIGLFVAREAVGTGASVAPAAAPSGTASKTVATVPVATAEVPSVAFDSLPVAARDGGVVHATAPLLGPRKAPSVASAPSVSASIVEPAPVVAPAPVRTSPAASASAAPKEGWKWGDRN
jgi:serine/threonine protein kinase